MSVVAKKSSVRAATACCVNDFLSVHSDLRCHSVECDWDMVSSIMGVVLHVTLARYQFSGHFPKRSVEPLLFSHINRIEILA